MRSIKLKPSPHGSGRKTGSLRTSRKPHHRFGLLALALALGALCLGLTAGSAAAAPSATFSTVNEDADGTGHCHNGPGQVNCNIYDGKQYVWLNGGPANAALPDGTYFFAVSAPGGQANPNDGFAKNLSDDYDAYTNRTFSVLNGIISYGGNHDFDSNKIRLMPYADTPNPGGVYNLAICSLADGYPVDPSTCKYDSFKVGDAQVPTADPLTVTKDANGAYNKTFAWTVSKAVDKTLVQQVGGGSATFNYTVTVNHDNGTISDVKVDGTISVFNPNLDENNDPLPVDINGVTDTLSDGTDCDVTGGGPQPPPLPLSDTKTDFTYSCDLGSTLPSDELDNTVTVDWSNQVLDNGAQLDAGSADFTFTGVPPYPGIAFSENEIDECANVTDSYAGTLGTPCVGDANPTTYPYQRTIAVPANDCRSYDNTATSTANDTGATDSASQTVTVCGPAKTGALTMGFWKGPNGNSLIQNYCAPASGTSLQTYLQNVGTSTEGPFKDAPLACGNSTSGLVKYVNTILGAASASDMNKMLKAQMLATALDVYFSGPGYSSTSSGSGKNQIKAPSSFLPNGGIDGFVMDLKAICPMVDNVSAGTATCKNNKPSTDAFAAGAVPWASRSVGGILQFAATTGTSPWATGAFTSPTWYGTDRTKQEILKNVFDQFNNQLAFGSF
jgi:hypothetical protein